MRCRQGHFVTVLLCTLAAPAALPCRAQDADELAKQLSNPVANLISVPLQLNWDDRLGPEEDGERYLLNVQPVIPISIGDDWNLISRTIVPIISQRDIFPGAGSQTLFVGISLNAQGALDHLLPAVRARKGVRTAAHSLTEVFNLPWTALPIRSTTGFEMSRP